MLDTMCLSTGDCQGLICRGHWSHITSLFFRQHVFLNTRPEAAGLTTLWEGYISSVVAYISAKLNKKVKHIPRVGLKSDQFLLSLPLSYIEK